MSESMGEKNMVTNLELVKEMTEKEENRLIKEALEAMKNKLDKVPETTDKVKEKLKDGEDKGKAIYIEDEVPKVDPPLK